MIFKNFWAHRKQNGFVFAEIVLIVILSFYMIDSVVVWVDSTYIFHAAGEFEKEHLIVGGTQRKTAITEKDGEDILAPLYAFRDAVRALPEVESVCLTEHFIGCEDGNWNNHRMAPEADTTQACIFYHETFHLNQHYFETTGLTAIEGSPSAESLSTNCPEDGVVITRSLARQLFGTDDVVGRRVVEIQYRPGPDARDVEFATRYTVAGVLEDVKPQPQERYCLMAFFPRTSFMGNRPMMLIRLKPDASAERFIEERKDIPDPAYTFRWLFTYKDYQENTYDITDMYGILTILGTLGLLFILNVMLGTLGTFWLQIRKRTEDIGIMRSFGAKRRDIFLQTWGEGALLTLVACIAGQLVWLQFAMNGGLSYGTSAHITSGPGIDWVASFWPHFLIVCAIQYLLMLAIVTLGMIVPSLIAMYTKPVNALRHE